MLHEAAAGLLGCFRRGLVLHVGTVILSIWSMPGGVGSGVKKGTIRGPYKKTAEKRAAEESRTAAKAAAAVVQQQAEKQKAVMREKHADQAMCIRRRWGSERIADKAAAAALAGTAPEAAVPAASAAQPTKGTLHSFFVNPPA